MSGMLEACLHVQGAPRGQPHVCSAAAQGKGENLGIAEHGDESPSQEMEQT